MNSILLAKGATDENGKFDIEKFVESTGHEFSPENCELLADLIMKFALQMDTQRIKPVFDSETQFAAIELTNFRIKKGVENAG